jgi:hypothetical protein
MRGNFKGENAMFRALYVVALMLMLSVSAFAQVTSAPSLLNFQGRLARPDGTPVPDGNYSIRFSLWTTAAGGTEKFNQTINPVTVRNGAFAVLLNVGTGPVDLWNADRFLEIKIGADAPLAPRQQLVSVAFALKANTVPDGSITSAKIADGTITAADIASGGFNALAWLLGGNSGTNPASNFLGTTDNQALVIKTNSQRAMRYEFATGSDGNNTFEGVNILGGHPLNTIASGVTAATIAGGGDIVNGNNFPNSITDLGGAVGGGASNRAGNNSGTVTDALYATVGGGFGNQAGGAEATIAGGLNNTSSGNSSAIGGGQANSASANFGTIPGGFLNAANGANSFAAGFRAKANHNGTFIWADSQNADFASTAINEVAFRAAGGFRIVSSETVSTSLGSGAFKILNAAGTEGLHFDSSDILSLGTTAFGLNGNNTCETRINGFVIIQTDGTVGIGDNTPDYRLELPNTSTNEGGRVRANRYDTYSSGRWKHNVAPIENALDKVLQLNGVMFDWLPEHGGTHDIGFVAEEVGRVLPELVSWESNGKFANGMAYDRLTALLVEATKQQQAQITAQQKQMEALKQSNESKEARIAELEARLERLEAAHRNQK